MLSQFLHGEQGALLATAKIVQACPGRRPSSTPPTRSPTRRATSRSTTATSPRKLGLSYECVPSLNRLLDDIITDSRWDITFLGMQIMVEGLALAAFGGHPHADDGRAPHPGPDRPRHAGRARHVAFGMLSLADLYTKEMSATELREREEFVIEATHLLRDRLTPTPVFEHLGWDAAVWTEWSNQTPFMRGFRQNDVPEDRAQPEAPGPAHAARARRLREARPAAVRAPQGLGRGSRDDAAAGAGAAPDAVHVAGRRRSAGLGVMPGRLAGQVAIVTGSSSGIARPRPAASPPRGRRWWSTPPAPPRPASASRRRCRRAIYVQGSVAEEAACHRLVAAAVEHFRAARHRRQQRRHDSGHSARRPRRGQRRALPPHPRRQPARHVVHEPRRPAAPAAESGRGDRQRHLARRRTRHRQFDPYAVSKAAINHLTRLLAKVVGPVRVNAVAPGPGGDTWTKDWAPIHATVARNAPLGRSATAEDLADAIFGVVTSRYMTGEVVVLDGGLGLVS